MADSAKSPLYIRTYPNSGYQFIAEIPVESSKFSVTYGVKIAVSTLFLMMSIAIYTLNQTNNKQSQSLPIPLTSLTGNEIDGGRDT